MTSATTPAPAPAAPRTPSPVAPEGAWGTEPALGARVCHIGTRRWGTVLEVAPRNDGALELLVAPDTPLYPGAANEAVWWPSYALDPRATDPRVLGAR